MSDISTTADQAVPVPNREPSLREFWLKEDWWAVWLGLGLVIAAFALFASGSNIGWIAVAPAKWSTFSELGAGFAANAIRYVTQFAIFLAIFTIAITALGQSAKAFIPAFLFIYILSLAVFAVGTWDQAQRYNLEPPLVALLVGLAISNLLIKVVGRDVWIGIWAFLLATISVTRWESPKTGRKVDAGQIWGRFPKFVIGFLLASMFVTLLVGKYSYADFSRIVKPGLSVLSSGYGSVGAYDGVCDRHGIYLSFGDSCCSFKHRCGK
jgi:hypothetical protein